ncbi:hypothetical protein ACTXT7_012312 [Hymenolepis weldensis]
MDYVRSTHEEHNTRIVRNFQSNFAVLSVILISECESMGFYLVVNNITNRRKCEEEQNFKQGTMDFICDARLNIIDSLPYLLVVLPKVKTFLVSGRVKCFVLENCTRSQVELRFEDLLVKDLMLLVIKRIGEEVLGIKTEYAFSNGNLYISSQIVISQVRAGGAAELAGLKVGSIVKGVNQQSIKDMSFLQVSNLIRRSSSLTTELTVCIPEEIPPAMNGNVVLRHTSAAKNPTFTPDSFSDSIISSKPEPNKRSLHDNVALYFSFRWVEFIHAPENPEENLALQNEDSQFFQLSANLISSGCDFGRLMRKLVSGGGIRRLVALVIEIANIRVQCAQSIITTLIDSTNCGNAAPSHQRIQSRTFIEQRQQQQLLQESPHRKEEVVALTQVPPPSADVLSVHSCQHPLISTATHDDNGNGMNHCGLRRQAILFCKDTVYVSEPPDFSPPISPISDAVHLDKPTPESDIDKMTSSFSTTLKVSDNWRREDEETEITPPPLVRRLAYPITLSSPLATSSGSPSPLIRDRSVKAGRERGPSPRFLPAHTSPTLQREESPQPTFLPRLSVRRKISSPALPSRPSPPNESKFTNLAAYMDGLVVPPPNGSTNGTSLSAIDAIAQIHLSASNSVLTPPRLVLPNNGLPIRLSNTKFEKILALESSEWKNICLIKYRLAASVVSLNFKINIGDIDLKTPIIPSPHDISSLSSPRNAPSNNETTKTNAKPPPPKRKRLTLMTGFFRTEYPSCNGSHWMASWHRRRCSLRPQDEFSNIKIASPLISTAEASRRSRSKPLKVLPTGPSDLQSQFYKSPLCLCKVTRMEGKDVTPVAWRRFFIYIGGGYIRFLLASDYHGFNQNASSSLLNNVDPFTLEGVSTSRCIILPLMSLQWSSQPFLSSDVPTWDTLAPFSLTNSSLFRRHYRPSQYSEMVESEITNDLPCYLFEHEGNGGSEITVIFPETQTLSRTLELCQRHGGVCKENDLSLSSSATTNSSLVTSHSTKQPSHHMTAALRRNRKSLPDSAIRRRLAADAVTGKKRTQDRSLDREGEQPPPLGSQRSAGVEDGSKFRFFSTTAAPFFKSIANAISISRAAEFNASSNNNTTAALQLSTEEMARRVTAALGEPPDFGDLNQPGPVFGAPLEKQVPSPDYPNVPLVLHATISALERHGLCHVGLYRAPGRQKEINRFVCLANLTSLDPHVMLSLATWSDVRVLTGVIKIFFRRLPEPICDSDSWKSLACLIPEYSDELDESSLVYTLQAIRAKLNKIRSTSYLPLNVSPTEQGTSVVSWRWRYATLDFLFTHLRRIIALEAANQCSFKCIAICFGPSLFNADNDLQNKFNVLLEVMLQHWPWLTTDESGALIIDSNANLSHNSSSAPRNTTISETEAYVKQFLEVGPNFNDLSFPKVVPQQNSLKIKDILKDMFERAGYRFSAGKSLENSDSKEHEEEQEEESLLDVIMRSLPQPVDELDGSSNG